ncbi:outer membrane protein transport protein [Gemmobacter denitrificans]|uniref:Outer membrane protein transport protein n=1 Tax=Gemmobacter denitrificans TaxID=3123040 RepID=A0ABU8BQG4_9RHOB
MKQFTALCGILAGLAGAAHAGGVDRSGQPIGIIFEKGNYAELSYGQINPSVSGNDVAAFGGRPSGQVADSHSLPGIALKYDFNESLSGAIIYDNAYGADIAYPTALAGGSVALGGTSAKLDSEGVTAILRYKFSESFSAHAGIRASKASGEVTLSGLAYGPVNGYNVSFDEDWGTGYLVGVAYEKPEIALRVALTYFSKVKHELDTTETFATAVGPIPGGVPLASVTNVNTPQAVNLDVQSGVAKDTLVFGSIRWVDWSSFLIDPARFTAVTGGGLVSLEDSVTYTLGVGRKFNDNWSGSVFATYEPSGDPLVSPLAPTNGYRGIGIAAVYTRDNMKITMGARYLDLGNAQPETGTPDTARADFRDNHATAVGIKVGFTF